MMKPLCLNTFLCLPEKLPSLIAKLRNETPPKNKPLTTSLLKGPLDGGLPGLRSKESDCTHVEQEDANGMELN